MTKSGARISEAEAVVMRALWTRSPRTAEEIAAEIADERTWGIATVKTLLNRLLRKRAIAAERDGRRYAYKPLLEEHDYVQSESQNLLDRLFGGRLAPLVMHFSERQRLTPEDLAELRQLIEGLDDR